MNKCLGLASTRKLLPITSTRKLLPRALARQARWIYSAVCLSHQEDKLVLGCGSNVIDHIYNVKVVPKVGDKGFFKSSFKALESKLIGGVTLNHLAWASLGGVPTGLLALQGHDELGHFIRRHLVELGVRTDFIEASDSLSTAQCHVFIQEDGERSILMAPAATSLIDRQAVEKYFDGVIRKHATLVTTEISQVPLSGVLAMLDSAKKANVLSVLDLDVSPSVAVKEAGLGSIEEVVECVKQADILKPAKAAAEELLAIMTGDNRARSSHKEMASELVQLCDSKLVAITNGSQSCILATKENVVEVAPPPVTNVIDTTGAGDAFLGGLIAWLTRNGLPHSTQDLSYLGHVANGYGATCVQSVGGVPVPKSIELLRGYLPEESFFPVASTVNCADKETDQKLPGFRESLQTNLEVVSRLVQRLDLDNVSQFMDVLETCEGQYLISGIGKSGHIAQRLASSLSSIGIPANFVHASEWVHGDLGKAQQGSDIALFLSHSGDTEECVKGAHHLVAKGVCTLTITGGKASALSKLSSFTLCYDSEGLQEPFDCLPSTSLIIQDAICNAIVRELIRRRKVTKEMFKRNHPGGSIGLKLKH